MVPKDLVLCVDDELLLLQTFAIAVPRAGFRVAVAENGAVGLRLFLQRRDEVCLVVSDIIMPVMNGIDMVDQILQAEPQTKILLMSAYSDRVIGRLARRARFPLIRKPFKYAKLIEEIRSIVGVPRLNHEHSPIADSLRRKLEQAQADYHRATDEYKRLMAISAATDGPHDPALVDGVYAMRKAMQIQRHARRAYEHALQTFNNFILRG